MAEEKIPEIIEILAQIEEDYTVPRNVRAKIKNAMLALQEEDKAIEVKINKSLQELDDITDDPNLPVYTRTQIWNLVSALETSQYKYLYINSVYGGLR